jgi:hypothetical protein
MIVGALSTVTPAGGIGVAAPGGGTDSRCARADKVTAKVINKLRLTRLFMGLSQALAPKGGIHPGMTAALTRGAWRVDIVGILSELLILFGKSGLPSEPFLPMVSFV